MEKYDYPNIHEYIKAILQEEDQAETHPLEVELIKMRYLLNEEETELLIKALKERELEWEIQALRKRLDKLDF